MKVIIDPMDHPLMEGESWWMIHLNNGELELKIPIGAGALCLREFYDFGEGTVYKIVGVNDDQGWVSIEGHGKIYEMPRYIFARYFDAIPFIRGGKIDEDLIANKIANSPSVKEILFQDKD